MLTILTTIDHKATVDGYIKLVDRLHELVEVSIDDRREETTDKILLVNELGISASLDWNDSEPPYLFPTLDLTKENLLSVILYKLGSHQLAFNYINQDNPFFRHLLAATNLSFGYTIEAELYDFVKQASNHNACIIRQYGRVELPSGILPLKSAYAEAIASATNDELRLFTIKHFVNMLLDTNQYAEAEQIIRQSAPKSISEASKNALNQQLSIVLTRQLSLPYNEELLAEIIDLQLSCVAFYEKYELTVQAGLVLIEASEVANFQKDFTASKFYIEKAIAYFKEADIPEFLGEAGLRKATLFYTWFKNGSPQYYKPAINAFQDTLKIFKRDTHPQKFADIHHNLALIYSEIPVSADEKPIWTAFCASSFKEVLSFYTKDSFPYEYAMVSHNYATALMNFPAAKLHDNFEKAFNLFEEALSIRTEDAYPFERALTLLNQLELYWQMHNESEDVELKRYTQMLEKVNSVRRLVKEQDLLDRAKQHLDQLKKLHVILS